MPRGDTDRRYDEATSVAFAGSATQSGVIPIGEYASGAFNLNQAEFNGNTITFYGCDTVDGTFKQIYKADGTSAVSFTMPNADIWILFDAAVMAHRFIKIATGTSTGGATTVGVVLKS